MPFWWRRWLLYLARHIVESCCVFSLSKAWDKLAHALAVASANSSTRPAVPLPVRPTLQLLEDKGRWQRVTAMSKLCLKGFPVALAWPNNTARWSRIFCWRVLVKRVFRLSEHVNAGLFVSKCKNASVWCFSTNRFDTIDTEKWRGLRWLTQKKCGRQPQTEQIESLVSSSWRRKNHRKT